MMSSLGEAPDRTPNRTTGPDRTGLEVHETRTGPDRRRGDPDRTGPDAPEKKRTGPDCEARELGPDRTKPDHPLAY